MQKVEHSSYYKYIYTNLALLAFFSLKPYPVWMVPSGVFQIVFLITTAISLLRQESIGMRPRLSKSDKRIVLSLILFAVFIALPIFHPAVWGYVGNALLFLMLLHINKRFFHPAYTLLKNIFYVISIASLLVWVLHVAGFNLPHIVLTPEFREEQASDNYHVYGLCVSLYRGSVHIGGGLERLCGVFAEPGHFGIYLGALMVGSGFRFNTRKDIVLLIAGILTFSTAFYGIMALGLIYRAFLKERFAKRRDLKRLFLLLVFILVPLLFISDKLYYTAISRVGEAGKVSGLMDFVDNRTRESTIYEYNRLRHSGNYLTGVYNVGDIDANEIQGTNWRGAVYRYGAFGMLSLIMLLVTVAASSKSKKLFLLVVCIGLLAISHRVYIVYSLGLFMTLYLSVNYKEFSEKIVGGRSSLNNRGRLNRPVERSV